MKKVGKDVHIRKNWELGLSVAVNLTQDNTEFSFWLDGYVLSQNSNASIYKRRMDIRDSL